MAFLLSPSLYVIDAMVAVSTSAGRGFFFCTAAFACVANRFGPKFGRRWGKARLMISSRLLPSPR